MSSLIQVPLVSRMLKSNQKVGVVVANSEALTQDHLTGVGIADEPMLIAGMQDKSQFVDVILKGNNNDLDMELFERELSQVVAKMLETNPEVGALVLECTDLSHFAPQLHKQFGLPVFDLTSLTRMVAATVNRTQA